MPNLRLILVTSQITYVPENYFGLFETFFKNSSKHIAGVIFLKNLDISLVKSVLGLRFLGAKNVQKALLKNIAQLSMRKREKHCDKYKIPFQYFSSMNDASAKAWCKKLAPDLIINARTRCIYQEPILKIPRLGCLNVHHGLLPKYRGTMCDLYALSQKRDAGFSIHQMNKKIDDGPLFKTQVVSHGDELNYLDYLKRSSRIEGETLSAFVSQVHDQRQLPTGRENSSASTVYSRNPTRTQVQQFLAQGMIL